MEDHTLENQEVDTCTRTSGIKEKYGVSDNANTCPVQNKFDTTPNVIDDNTTVKCATQELSTREKPNNAAADFSASDVKQSSSCYGSTATDQAPENPPDSSNFQERDKDKTKINEEENVLSFLHVHRTLSVDEEKLVSADQDTCTTDSSKGDRFVKTVNAVSNPITSEDKFYFNLQEKNLCAREVELNLLTRENNLSKQESKTVEQKRDLKTPASGELSPKRRESDDPNSLLHTRSCPDLEPKDPLGSTVFYDSRSRENVTFEAMENYKTTNDWMCKSITDDGIEERGESSKPQTAVDSGKHKHTPSSQNDTKYASRDRSYSGPPVWSQVNPIPSVPSPVRFEDLHYSRVMNNITLGFEGVTERIRVTPGRPVRRSSGSSSPLATPKTGRSVSTSSPPANLRRTKKPARTFRRFTSWDEQLVRAYSTYVLFDKSAPGEEIILNSYSMSARWI